MAATGIVLELDTAQSSERQGAATNRLLAPYRFQRHRHGDVAPRRQVTEL